MCMVNILQKKKKVLGNVCYVLWLIRDFMGYNV